MTKPDSRPLLYTNTVPGWSNHFNDEAEDAKDLTTDKLVEWSKIDSLDTYRDRVGYDLKQPNYALELNGGDKITHNNFVVPDWGNLRFDLFTENLNGGQVNVSIQSDVPGFSDYNLGSITLTNAEGTLNSYADDRYKIGSIEIVPNISKIILQLS